MRKLGQWRCDQGAVLLIVLLLVTLVLVLMTTMLAVSSNEIAISGLQRDSARALDLAQAGLVEAARRIEAGRPYQEGFAVSSPASGGPMASEVTVVRRWLGVNAAYVQVDADVSAGRAARRLSQAARHQGIAFPPNSTVAQAVLQQDAAEISCGDVYARGVVRYVIDPNHAAARCASQPPSLTYAGWRISICEDPRGPCTGDDDVPPCYRVPCADSPRADTARWYPGTRLAVPLQSPGGEALAALATRCPAAEGGGMPDPVFTGRLASEQDVVDAPVFGFDRDDPDGAGPIPPQAVIPSLLPCGIPYRYDLVTFEQEDGTIVQRYMKTIVYEHWFAAYWRFDAWSMAYVKRSGRACADASCLPDGLEPNLVAHPQFGAVPLFPELRTVTANFDCRRDAPGTLLGVPIQCDRPAGQSISLGCKSPEMTCSPAVDQAVAIVFNGDMTINALLRGHGTLVATGALTVPIAFEYWGMIIVGGDVRLGPDQPLVHGGVVAGGALHMEGGARIEGGGLVPSIPVGRAVVVPQGWWER